MAAVAGGSGGTAGLVRESKVLGICLSSPASTVLSVTARARLHAARAMERGEQEQAWPAVLLTRPRLRTLLSSSCRTSSFIVYFRHMWSMFHVWTHLHCVGFAAAVLSVTVYLKVCVWCKLRPWLCAFELCAGLRQALHAPWSALLGLVFTHARHRSLRPAFLLPFLPASSVPVPKAS